MSNIFEVPAVSNSEICFSVSTAYYDFKYEDSEVELRMLLLHFYQSSIDIDIRKEHMKSILHFDNYKRILFPLHRHMVHCSLRQVHVDMMHYIRWSSIRRFFHIEIWNIYLDNLYMRRFYLNFACHLMRRRVMAGHRAPQANT